MSHELKVSINRVELPIKEYRGQRVVTLKEIDMVHERTEGTARKRFNDNKSHFIETVDFFKVKCAEVRPFFGQTLPNGFNPDADITLITESGYLMLVKSFTDDLAWAVQRQLVNTYFRSTPEQRRKAAQDTAKAVLAEAKLNNSRARLASEWRKLAELNPIPEYRQICAHYASAVMAGEAALPLPEVQERTYTATEVGQMLGGISAAMVGKLANDHHLKTPEYGVKVWDKAKHCEKQVASWRYNDKGVDRLREILDGNN